MRRGQEAGGDALVEVLFLEHTARSVASFAVVCRPNPEAQSNQLSVFNGFREGSATGGTRSPGQYKRHWIVLRWCCPCLVHTRHPLNAMAYALDCVWKQWLMQERYLIVACNDFVPYEHTMSMDTVHTVLVQLQDRLDDAVTCPFDRDDGHQGASARAPGRTSPNNTDTRNDVHW